MRLARQDGEVYTFIGDGTYLMNPTELATVAQGGLAITVVLSCNHGYQCIRALQEKTAGHAFGNEFRRRDEATGRLEGEYLAANAHSLGARTWSAATLAELRAALDEARAHRGPCVIVVETSVNDRGPASEVWWDVMPAEVSGDPETNRARAAYESGRRLQRYLA